MVDRVMLWAAAALCFHGFVRAGEITIPSVRGFVPAVHIACGDVEADSYKPIYYQGSSKAAQDRSAWYKRGRCICRSYR